MASIDLKSLVKNYNNGYTSGSSSPLSRIDVHTPSSEFDDSISENIKTRRDVSLGKISSIMSDSSSPISSENACTIEQDFLDEDEVFEVKMRKNAGRTANDGVHQDTCKKIKKSNGNHGSPALSSSSSFLNSSFYSASTLSLNKYSFFSGTPARKNNRNDSISMSLSRAGGSDGDDNVKITGYLEKRSKMLGWKKYWFVLDGRLLTYYKSKDDYDSLSACCGSINLGIASTIRPIQIKGCKGYPLQIVTRSQVYYLRSPDKQILEQWLLASQEASSSQPSKISLPVWSDPGSQFFRYSFASSQWSLNGSNENISDSLSKLPPNFYLKGSSPILPDYSQNHIKKCHSLVSLPTATPDSGPFAVSSSHKDKMNNNSLLKQKKRGSLEAEVALTKELSKKLSVGKVGENENVKPSLTKAKSKNELPFIMNRNLEGNETHYDEIVDFETSYDSGTSGSTTRNSSISKNSSKSSSSVVGDDGVLQVRKGENNDNGIYEVVEDVNDNLPNVNIVKKLQHSEIRHSSGSSRKSTQSTKSEGNNRKIKDVSNDFESEKNQSASNPNTLSNHKSHAAVGIDTVVGPGATRTGSIDSESSTYSSKENIASDAKGRKWKSKPFGGFFHKMFHREKKKKSKKEQEKSLIITGPLDLRSLHNDSPMNRPTNLPVDEARKNSLTRTQSGYGGRTTPLGMGVEQANVMEELKVKVDRINHQLPALTSVADHILSKASQEDEEDSSEPKKPEQSETLKRMTKERPKIPKKPQISKTVSNKIESLNAFTPNSNVAPFTSEDASLEEQPVKLRKTSQSEEFQKKLAKFNRLSQRLSSTFVAALNPSPQNNYLTIGPLGRSHSFKLAVKPKFALPETVPPLPPKMKNSTKVQKIYYDYPSSKRQMPDEENEVADENIMEEETPAENDVVDEKLPNAQISLIRSLHKKNSAPDILFSETELGVVEKEVDSVFEEFLSPPPIPPKVNSTSSLGSPSIHEREPSPLGKVVEGDYKIPICMAKKVEEHPQASQAEIVIENPPTYVNVSSSSDTNPKSLEPKDGKDDERVYQNIKYAMLSTLVQEYETVEETADELSEMYDDFPSEYSGGSHTYESISPLPLPDYNLRHSGFDSLQKFLQETGEPEYSEAEGDERTKLSKVGAVSRLGHSSAVEQLKKIVGK